MNNLIKHTLQFIPQFVEEANKLTIYHGDNFGLDKITGNYKLMNLVDSRQQEGPGIYFSNNIETAYAYGNKIVETTIDPKKFMKSREKMGKYLSTSTISKILKEIAVDDDEFWYLLTEYGIEVTEPEDVEEYHWDQLAEIMRNEQVRNFLITLSDKTSTENFVKAFTKHCKYFGTYNNQNDDSEIWFALLRNDDEPRPVK